MTWPLSAFATSLPLDTADAITALAGLGFTHVDLYAREERPEADLEALADTGLMVACPSLVRGLPDEQMLDAEDLSTRRATLGLLQQRIADAARLGATRAYLIPGRDQTEAGLARFADGCGHLAAYAAGRMVRLLVEPVPGRALPRADGTLAWLREAGIGNLGLLLDVGHCLITGEDPAEAVRAAGPLLGHVHLDDNDGESDLHWPLCTGRLTEAHLRDLAGALRSINYAGLLSLEFRPDTDDPAGALRQGKEKWEALPGCEAASG